MPNPLAPLSRARARLNAFAHALTAGDRLIAGVLGGLVVLGSFYAIAMLRDRVLIEIPSHGGTLTEGIVGSPRFVNPLLAISDADRDMTALVYAGLMGEDGSGNLVPVLAERYEISEDGRTYTFTLRGGASFSDGSAVTADDVVFTVEKAKDPSLKSPEFANWTGVTAIAVAPDVVEFHLDKAYAPFLENTTLGILPAHLWKNEGSESFPFSDLMTVPVGAGPYAVAAVRRNAKTGVIESYELKSFSDYALGRPYLETIRLEFFADSADLREALDAGTIQSAYGTPGATTRTTPYSRVFGVFWNANQNPLFSRLEVRKALSIAIDRNRIAEDTLGGFATPLAGPVPPGSGIAPTPIPPTATRLEDAAAVLEDAGWKYDDEARVWKQAKAGLTLAVTLKTSNVPELKAVAAQVKSDWESFGVPVSVELYEPGDLTQNVIRPRKYEALLFGMVVGRDHDLYAFWDSAERNDPGLNIALYTNSTVDGLLESMRSAGSGDPVQNLQKVNDLIAAEYPAAFIYAPKFAYALPERVQGVLLPQIATPSDRFASVANWFVRTEKVWPVFKDHR